MTCPSCFGRWMTNIALLRRLRRDVQEARQTPPGGIMAGGGTGASLEDLAAVVTVANSKRAVRCPRCEKPMVKGRVHQMVPVDIDRCKPCDSVWMDTGEYALIRRLYVEMSTTEDPRLVALREKVAGVQLALENRKEALNDERRVLRATHSMPDANGVVDFTVSALVRMLRP